MDGADKKSFYKNSNHSKCQVAEKGTENSGDSNLVSADNGIFASFSDCIVPCITRQIRSTASITDSPEQTLEDIE